MISLGISWLFSFSEPLSSVKSIKEGLIRPEHTDLLKYLIVLSGTTGLFWVILKIFKSVVKKAMKSVYPNSYQLFVSDIKMTIHCLFTEHSPHCLTPRELDHIH